MSELNEQEKLVEELQITKEMYRVLSKLSPVGIFRIDENNKCVYVNDRWAELTGLDKSLCLGDGWKEAIYFEDFNSTISEWNYCFQNHQKFNHEFRIHTPAGKIIWVLGQGNPVNGGSCGYVGTITDITNQKEVLPQLIELRDSRTQLRR